MPADEHAALHLLREADGSTHDAQIVATIIAITDEFEPDSYRRVTAELRARGLVVTLSPTTKITL